MVQAKDRLVCKGNIVRTTDRGDAMAGRPTYSPGERRTPIAKVCESSPNRGMSWPLEVTISEES
jgi:hypothetical protein